MLLKRFSRLGLTGRILVAPTHVQRPRAHYSHYFVIISSPAHARSLQQTAVAKFLMITINTCRRIAQVRTVRQVHRQPSHVDVVLGHMEPGSVDSVHTDHVRDRRVHVAGRENQVRM